MEILCHSQIGLTMGTYSDGMPTAQREAAEPMGGILAAAATGSAG